MMSAIVLYQHCATTILDMGRMTTEVIWLHAAIKQGRGCACQEQLKTPEAFHASLTCSHLPMTTQD